MENQRTAVGRIHAVLSLRHTLNLVDPLVKALQKSANPLFMGFAESLNDKRFDQISQLINEVVDVDVNYEVGK